MKLLRRSINRLAQLTPNTVYTPDYLAIKVNDALLTKAIKIGGSGGPMASGVMAFVCGLQVHRKEAPTLGVGDSAVVTISGITHSGRELGDYKVTVERVG